MTICTLYIHAQTYTFVPKTNRTCACMGFVTVIIMINLLRIHRKGGQKHHQKYFLYLGTETLESLM